MPTISGLLLGDNQYPWHQIDERGPDIKAALGEAVDLTVTTDKRRLLDLESFDVYVDYTSHNVYEADELDAIRSFVEGGGGYLAIHTASDLTSRSDGEGGIDSRDEPIPELREILGGHFLGHPEETTFGVDILADHPVTDGVDDFEVYDEPYKLDVDEDRVAILARMDHPDEAMDDYPIVWVRDVGDGRLCFSSLGHGPRSLENEAYRRLLRNAVKWVAGGN